MAKIHESRIDGAGLRIGIVVSRFNQVVTERLLEGTLDGLLRHGVEEEMIEVAHVPGAFELPLPAALMAADGRFDAVICLGALVRGETPHFDFISSAVVGELNHLMVKHRLPIVLGVLTTNSVDQALERSGGGHGNKGLDAALAAIEMANLCRGLI